MSVVSAGRDSRDPDGSGISISLSHRGRGVEGDYRVVVAEESRLNACCRDGAQNDRGRAARWRRSAKTDVATPSKTDHQGIAIISNEVASAAASNHA